MELRMKADYINPFIQSVGELFENMLNCKIDRKHPELIEEDGRSPDIIGVIGLSGTAQGVIALRFPVETALKAIGRMVGAEFKSVDSSIIDGVGEIINIVAGNGKAKFRGHTISLSLPTVVRGSICNMQKLDNTVFLTVPFTSELGDFSLMVTFKPAVCQEKERADAGVGCR